jgi:hypothetical protein
MKLNRLTIVAGLVVLVVVAVLALALSGGRDTELVSSSAIAQAARTTQKVPGETVSVSAVIDVDGLDEPLEMHLEGVQDARGHSGRMAGDYENFPKQVPGQDSDGNVPIEIVSLVPDVYMRSPLFKAALPDGKSWLHIDLAQTGKELGIGDPTQFGTSDPSETLSDLEATSDRVERVGKEDVRGVPTTHYSATIELRKLPAVVPPAKRASARQKADRLIELIGTDSYPVDVWVDRHHLVRRIQVAMKMKIPEQSQNMHIDITTEMYDFGPKPKAERPSASETAEAAKLAGGTTP